MNNNITAVINPTKKLIVKEATYIKTNSFASMVDVDLTGLADKNLIEWDATAGAWVPCDTIDCGSY